MIEDSIAISLIAGIINAARRNIGDDAIRAANEVPGLAVNGNGEIVLTGEFFKIVGDLCRSLEKAMRGSIVVDLDVRMNLKRSSG